MTKKDFFRIIIKLFGLYWLISSFFSMGQIAYFATTSNSNWFGLIYSVVVLFVLIFLFFALIFKADTIIDKLKLDKGFDEDRIEFQNFNVENILILAIVIIGSNNDIG